MTRSTHIRNPDPLVPVPESFPKIHVYPGSGGSRSRTDHHLVSGGVQESSNPRVQVWVGYNQGWQSSGLTFVYPSLDLYTSVVRRLLFSYVNTCIFVRSPVSGGVVLIHGCRRRTPSTLLTTSRTRCRVAVPHVRYGTRCDETRSDGPRHRTRRGSGRRDTFPGRGGRGTGRVSRCPPIVRSKSGQGAYSQGSV